MQKKKLFVLGTNNYSIKIKIIKRRVIHLQVMSWTPCNRDILYTLSKLILTCVMIDERHQSSYEALISLRTSIPDIFFLGTPPPPARKQSESTYSRLGLVKRSTT